MSIQTRDCFTNLTPNNNNIYFARKTNTSDILHYRKIILEHNSCSNTLIKQME